MRTKTIKSKHGRPGAVSHHSSQTFTRRLLQQQLFKFDEFNGANVVFERELTFALANFQGAEAIANNWEQYRFKRVRIFIHSAQTEFSEGGVVQATNMDLIKSPLFQNMSTIVYTAVDVNTPTGSSAGANIFAYNNLEYRSLSATKLKIADFSPRIKTNSNTSLIRETSTFISCNSLDIFWVGLQIYLVNSNGAAFFQNATAPSVPLEPQCFNITIEADVEFRHPAYRTPDFATTSLPIPQIVNSEYPEGPEDWTAGLKTPANSETEME